MNRRLAAVAALLATGVATLVPLAAAQVLAAPAGVVVSGATRPDDSSFSETKTLQRVITRADGTEQDFPAYDVTVDVDKTENLRGRQRVEVSWSGAPPSAGRANNPYGEAGLAQEYPVVIMQCRGVDDPSLPADQQLSPETCWTASVAQRSQITRGDSESAWRHDLLATDAEKERVTGIDPIPDKETCPTADIAGYSTKLTPFVAANGTVYPACSSSKMPPEAAVGAAFPPAEINAFTDLDGNGSVQFEVRSDVENESLGCNNEVACSIVVIPIVGLSCDQPSSPMTASDLACRKTGRFAPGSGNFVGEGVDQAVSPVLWWSPSNWQNRFSVPITFGLPPDACDILDDRAPTGFYGTELLAQAALQWSPAYCLSKSRFKFQHNQMSDEAGWNLMETGGGAAALVSSEHQQIGDDPVVYAPTAVTGFAIGYVIDLPDNQGEVTDLKLTPRLVAKLLTQSYLGSELGRDHPGMSDNPLSIMQDPEFIKLNPGLSQINQEVGATLLSLSNQSDVMYQLTDWIAHDKDAMDFVNGEADPWGMVVNPNYKKLTMPTAEIPLLDSYIPETGNVCRQQNPAVYFNQLAAPVTTLRKISDALLDAWPNVQTRCDFDPDTGLYKLGRISRQSFGARFMLGLVSLGDVDRYGLRAAALQAKPGTFVAPNDASMAAAVGLSKQAGAYEPFVLDQAAVRQSRSAYPVTMVVYTAARAANLDAADAAKVAQFITISTTEGQVPGSGNGELPAGFLPIRKTGVTAPLYASAQKAAVAVAAQDGISDDSDEPTDTESPSATPTSTGGNGTGGGVTTPVTIPDDVPSAEEPTEAASPSATPDAEAAAPVAMPPTELVGSRVAGSILPLLLFLALLGGVGLVASRFFVRPPRPGAGS